MQSFIKFYSGLLSHIENEINSFAKERNLTIKSCSMTVEQGYTYVAVVYEKLPFDMSSRNIVVPPIKNER